MLSAKDLLTTYHQAEHQQRAEQQYLALEKRRDRRKQADLDAGRLVRICIDQDGEEPNTGLFPARVAAFVCRVLGDAQPTARDCVRFTLTTQGRLHAAYYPERRAYQAILALLAHARAVTKVERRRRN
ncbi:hypothetical protein FNT36_14385 [Hymenobacter setariae]|uniref:Uncharacterized protein n=1 Tax=Hymenobacter setariae TaxID=2594794 RepID=A0A558BW29_9BACT|nr:hypothetical protein [Hymenobacter setariae]TVT40653.1 hypothetical protein FNT36_14385 [Hymenobacter setariae]